MATLLGHGWYHKCDVDQSLVLFEKAITLGDINACVPFYSMMTASDQSFRGRMYQKLILQYAANNNHTHAAHLLSENAQWFDSIPLGTLPGFGFYGQRHTLGTPFHDRVQFSRFLDTLTTVNFLKNFFKQPRTVPIIVSISHLIHQNKPFTQTPILDTFLHLNS